MEKRHVEAVIFDMDGTLIDSMKDIVDSLNYTLKELGIPEKPSEIIRDCIGLGRGRLIKESLGRAAPPEMIIKAANIFSSYYCEHMLDTTVLFSGVLETLEYLKEKTLILLTNKVRELTVQTLKHFKIYDYFFKVYAGDDGDCIKPEPCAITNPLNEIGITKSEAIIIGDSDIDIQAGKSAGIITCAMTYGIGRKKDIEKACPDYILDDIRKLKDVIY